MSTVRLTRACAKRGQITLELLLAIALIAVVSTLLLGSLKMVSELCGKITERSYGLRDEVWFVGLVTRDGSAQPGVSVIAPDEQPNLFIPGTVAADSAIEVRDRPLKFRVAAHDFEAEVLVKIQVREQDPAWLVGGLQGARRWP